MSRTGLPLSRSRWLFILTTLKFSQCVILQGDIILWRQPDLAPLHRLDILTMTTRLLYSSNLIFLLAASIEPRRQADTSALVVNIWVVVSLSRRSASRSNETWPRLSP